VFASRRQQLVHRSLRSRRFQGTPEPDTQYRAPLQYPRRGWTSTTPLTPWFGCKYPFHENSHGLRDVVPGDLPRGLYNTDRITSPRFRFAWDVFGDGHYGMAAPTESSTIRSTPSRAGESPFVGGRRTFVNGTLSNPFASVGLPRLLPIDPTRSRSPIRSTASGAPPAKTACAHVRAGVERHDARELFRNYSVSGAYIRRPDAN
jgi:hypothetical protein